MGEIGGKHAVNAFLARVGDHQQGIVAFVLRVYLALDGVEGITETHDETQAVPRNRLHEKDPLSTGFFLRRDLVHGLDQAQGLDLLQCL